MPCFFLESFLNNKNGEQSGAQICHSWKQKNSQPCIAEKLATYTKQIARKIIWKTCKLEPFNLPSILSKTKFPLGGWTTGFW
jgi:hypothetical protein